MSTKFMSCVLAATATFCGMGQATAGIDATLWGIYSNDIKFSPKKVENAYLELEYMGQTGPIDWYGYFDAPKYFGGNDNINGVWDKEKNTSFMFMEHQPKLSFNRLTGKDLSIGPFKDWFIAADWILDAGNDVLTRQHTLYYGLGTSIDTHTKLGMNVNIFTRQQWENYGAANAYTSNDGGRLQVQFFYPIYRFSNGGSVNYFTFSNYDFGSKLGERTAGGTRTNEALVSTHIFSYQLQNFRAYTAARYFHNGSQFKDGAINNWGSGDFAQDSTGWGYYVGLGYKF